MKLPIYQEMKACSFSLDSTQFLQNKLVTMQAYTKQRRSEVDKLLGKLRLL
jgi:hypothetical protein